MANATNQNKPFGQEGMGQSGQHGQHGQHGATGTLEQAREAVSAVGEKAKSAASSVAHSAGETASQLGQKAEDAASAVGGGLKSLGDQVRQSGPHSGVLGSASARVADTLEHTGRYLQEEGLAGLADDLSTMVRRNPIPALLVGLGVGFLLARALTPRS